MVTQQSADGQFVDLSFVIDTETISKLDANSEEFKYIIVNLFKALNFIVLALNAKDTGTYNQQELVTGQQFFQNPNIDPATEIGQSLRFAFRMTVNFGPLPNTGTKSVPHNIPITTESAPQYTATRIYAAATDVAATTFIPIPFSSPIAAENIKIDVDNTNVNITTGSNRSNYTICIVVIEYLKQ